jgi:hypothetical protein
MTSSESLMRIYSSRLHLTKYQKLHASQSNIPKIVIIFTLVKDLDPQFYLKIQNRCDVSFLWVDPITFCQPLDSLPTI